MFCIPKQHLLAPTSIFYKLFFKIKSEVLHVQACDPFSAELFKPNSDPQTVPCLCNSSADNSFCSSLWESCQNVLIWNSPFAPALQIKVKLKCPQNITVSKLTDLWPLNRVLQRSNAFGGASTGNSFCLMANLLPSMKLQHFLNQKSSALRKLAMDLISTWRLIQMDPIFAFFSGLAGKIWLALISDQDSGNTLGLEESSPSVDLTDQDDGNDISSKFCTERRDFCFIQLWQRDVSRTWNSWKVRL